MHAIFLGACANQTANQEGVSFIVYPDDLSLNGGLLVDTGVGVVGALLRLNRRASDIEHVYLTHTHADHFGGFPYFVWQRFYEAMTHGAKPGNLSVYGTAGVLKSAEQYLNICYNTKTFPFETHFIEAKPDIQFDTDGMTVRPVAVNHTAETLGMIVTANGRSLAYSADTTTAPNFIDACQGVNLLVHEGMWTEAERALATKTKHSTAKEAGEVASKSGAGALVLVHIFPPVIGSEGQLIAEARREYGGPISIASAGSVFSV